ncbi:HNH endonuclease signature motif containing protein [Herbiconiux sp. L3-i23]|uniref:HNH endonuclease signature motif containing protein n=1 Tax=Herbiconiux sp. L3-i23 TaxID=2905871 RepID=UPI002053D3E3|nr:HNH endonuclease signature motif containing protein [Herbiconiux sp. L3-i23]BDI22883.1 hypothetical protein L3i23_16590 [Herbiconiux sp. L3-i23]
MGTDTVALLAEQAALLSTRGQTLSAGNPSTLVESLMGSADTDLLAFAEHAAQVVRLAEAAFIAAAGEVARRSERTVPDPLSRRLGEKSAAALLAKRTGAAEVDVAVQARLGLALSPREGLTGEILPSYYPSVSQALADGELPARSAAVIVRTLVAIAPNASLEQLEGVEDFLVDGALQEWDAVMLADVCRALPGRFDPDGIEPREAARRARRAWRERELEDGSVRFTAEAPPEQAAFVRAAMDARTAPRRQVRFTEVGEEEGDLESAPEYDSRTWEQKRLDAFVDIMRESLSADDGEMGGVDTTLVLHMIDEAYSTGVGEAWIEGVDGLISARTGQHLASSANVVTVVLDCEGQPLWLGTTRRFFTRAQRRAMAARDGGCQWPGCTAPPRWCDAAHIIPWSQGGRTDIENGILLCHFHHRRFDEDGWTLTITNGVPWFTPPRHLDASRTPRRGGRRRTPADLGPPI